MSEEFRDRLQAAKLEENIQRVDYLLGNSKNINAQGLGIKLALAMTLEISQGQALGSDSSQLVVAWMKEHPESIVEEAIVVARQFLTNPQGLTDAIGKKLFDEDGAQEAEIVDND
jgi:hypothetical protein